MRIAPMVVAATVALASTVSAAPSAHAQIDVVDTPIDAPDVVEELGLTEAPPAVYIDGVLHVLINGSYHKADRELPAKPEGPDRGSPYPKPAEDKQEPDKQDEGNRAADVAKWLVPLLVTGGVIAGLAGLFQKLYPSGRLIMYYQPGKSFSL